MGVSCPRFVIACDHMNVVGLGFWFTDNVVFQPTYGRFLFTEYSVCLI